MRHALLLVPALAGCSTYAQHRAAFVPHATPLPTDGQPLQAPGEVTLGASNLTDLAAPRVGNPDDGDVVPNTQLRGSIAARLGKNVALSGIYEHGLATGAHVIKASEPPIKDADPYGIGGGIVYSIPTSDPHWRLAMSAELVFWSIPWVEYTTCISECSVPGFTYMDRGRDTIPVGAFGLTPSYRSGALTLFAGGTVRNHPTIVEKVITALPDSDGDVQSGPANVTFHAGASLELGSGVRASLIVHQTATTDPIAYRPAVAAFVSIPLGDRDQPPPQP